MSAFAEDRQGNIWMGLLKGGLYRYDGHGFRYFQRSDGFPGGMIGARLADEGGLWIGIGRRRTGPRDEHRGGAPADRDL